MSGVVEKRIAELNIVKDRLEDRLLRVTKEIAYFEEAARKASHPLDICVCPEGTRERCSVTSGHTLTGQPARRRLEDCGTYDEVFEYLAVNAPNGAMTIKLGDAVRACKQRGWDPDIRSNSLRSKLERRLTGSNQWEVLGDATFRFCGRVTEDASTKLSTPTDVDRSMAA